MASSRAVVGAAGGTGRATRDPQPVPVSHSLLAPRALIAEIRTAYGLDASATCTLLRPGLNDTYLVLTPDARFVARVYGAAWRCASEVAFELELLAHLAGRGVSVAAPIEGRDGALDRAVAAPEGPRRLALFAYADGEPLTWQRPEHCRLAGRLAGSIHSAADSFVSRRHRASLDLDYLVERALADVRPFLAGRPAELRYVERLALRLRSSAEAAVEGGLDWGPCHGDFGPKNVHVREGGAATVFDFDLCGNGWRAYDFATVYRASRREPAIWDAFLCGYREVRSLGDADMAAVPLFRALRHFAMLGSFARHAPEWGTLPLTLANLDRWLSFFRQWESVCADRGVQGVRRPASRGSPRSPRLRPVPVRPRRHLPVVYSIVSPGIVAKVVSAAYPIGLATSCQLLRRGLHDSYRLETASGSYVARLHRTTAVDSHIAYELELLARLSSRGITVSDPVATATGTLVHSLRAPEGARPVVLFRAAPGRELSWEREDDGRMAGELAAELHAAADGFVSRQARPPIDLEHLVDRPLAELHPRLEPRRDDRRFLRSFAETLREAAAAAIARGLDWGPCHGELGPSHIRLDGDGRATIFDFATCGPGWRAYDFSIVEWGAVDERNRGFREAFLDGYRARRPLSDCDLAALDLFQAMRRLHTLGRLAANADVWGTRPLSEALLTRELAFFRGARERLRDAER